MRRWPILRMSVVALILGIAFQNCSRLGVEDLSSLEGPTAKDLVIDAEWEKARENFRDYIRTAPTAQYAYPIYNVQLSTAAFLQYAVERGNPRWKRELRELYLLGAAHLKTVNSLLYYYPVTFHPDGSFTSPYRAEIPLQRSHKVWADSLPPESGLTSPSESILVSSQFFYPISVLIWEYARKNELAEPGVSVFVETYWDTLVRDNLLRWIFNDGTPQGVETMGSSGGVANSSGIGAFQLQGWGCNSGDFSHSERVEHLTHRRFGTAFFTPLYPGGSHADRGYCNSVHDTDLWILANIAHVLAAHQLAPSRLPLSSSDFLRLKAHLQAGLELVLSRIQFQTALDFEGNAVETAQWELGGFDGHPDYAYTGDRASTFPGYSVEGGAPARSPTPVSNVGWDVSHARRLVQFFWTIEKLQAPLGLSFPIGRVMKGMASQVAYVTFNRNFDSPKFSNFLDGTDGWYRVNYSGRVGFGYPPGSWDLGGRSILTGGYAFWERYNPDLRRVILSAEKAETYPSGLSWRRLESWPSLPDVFFK